MNTENRDFVIERFERQLSEKNDEIETIKKTLRDSILHELRNDIKNDLEINNRLVKIEQAIKEITSNINGIMDELFDQKSQIRSLKRSGMRDMEQLSTQQRPSPAQTPAENIMTGDNGRGQNRETGTFTDSLFRAGQEVQPVEVHSGSPANPEINHTSQNEMKKNHQWRSSPADPVVKMEICDIKPEAEGPLNHSETKNPLEMASGNSIKSEYIVASSKDIPKKQAVRENRQNTECEYIVAEETDSKRKTKETEYETVEDREDEDTVVTTLRKK